MKRSTTGAAVAGALVVLGSLAGCGGDDNGGDTAAEPETTTSSTDAYCASLEEARDQFQSLEGGDQLTTLDEVFATLRGLGEQAPEEVSRDWDTLVAGIDQVEEAVADAGLTLDELAEIQANPNDLPEGVDLAKLQALGQEFAKLSDAEFTAAFDSIETHAKDECDITLDNSGGASGEPAPE